jgi:hypothetical protein
MAGFDEFVFGGIDLSLEEELHEQAEGFRGEKLSHFLVKGKEFTFGEVFLKIKPAFKEVLYSGMSTSLKPLFWCFLQVKDIGEFFFQLFWIEGVNLIIDKVVLSTGPVNEAIKERKIILVSTNKSFLFQMDIGDGVFGSVESGVDVLPLRVLVVKGVSGVVVGCFEQVLGFGGQELAGDFVVEFGPVLADHEQEGLEGEWVTGLGACFSEDLGPVQEVEQLVLWQLDFGFGFGV